MADSRKYCYICAPNELTPEQRNYQIPSEAYWAVFNFSCEHEELLEKGIIETFEHVPAFKGDEYMLERLDDDASHALAKIKLIDSFHRNLPGAKYCFMTYANICREQGFMGPLIEALQIPSTEDGDDSLTPRILPPRKIYLVDDDGSISLAGQDFNRNDELAMQFNFFNGLESPDLAQRERFEKNLFRLEHGAEPSFFQGADDDHPIHDMEIKAWNDKDNTDLLSSLEKAKKPKGRPNRSSSDLDVKELITYAKNQYLLSLETGGNASINGAASDALNTYNIAQHNQEKTRRRIQRALKQKLRARGLLRLDKK